ncbi:hypothetical protein M011DRAFT_501702 [Sporormia fimetaria CBS 119925]|uniref:Uncharacterized protein n=1 Tax=Sporormia fimetaria CBS 119925 TaxID=1340428 RepID=A0A6A6VBY8_9PLEO|nr:hypothetical protein M011DRAFT_501702 [Sporormia fimetaria CBS 119925]
MKQTEEDPRHSREVMQEILKAKGEATRVEKPTPKARNKSSAAVVGAAAERLDSIINGSQEKTKGTGNSRGMRPTSSLPNRVLAGPPPITDSDNDPKPNEPTKEPAESVIDDADSELEEALSVSQPAEEPRFVWPKVVSFELAIPAAIQDHFEVQITVNEAGHQCMDLQS